MARGLWLRVYVGIVDSRKIQGLPDRLFRALVNLWCLAKENRGVLPPVNDIAWRLRTKPEKVDEWIRELKSARLMDETPGGYVPHDWADHQYLSDDTATERAEKSKRAKSNVGNLPKPTLEPTPKPTCSETETETETEQSKRAASPHSRPIWLASDEYRPFVTAYRVAKPDVLDDELAEAFPLFLKLAFDQRLKAVVGINRRVQTGIWRPDEPRFTLRPAKYLQTEWKREIKLPADNDTGPPAHAIL